MRCLRPLFAFVVAISFTRLEAADPPVAPETFLGHAVCADYKLARWERILEYFRRLDAASDRVVVQELGKTTEGVPMIAAFVSSEANIRDLAKHRDQQSRIADPRRLRDDADAKQLVEQSPAVVLINCNLHSTEIASSQLSMELAWELATKDTPEILEILNRTILILIPSANPDGVNKVIDWYERSRNEPWEGNSMPWLYQKYAGHDNNRDWFMLALQETRLMVRLMYREWRPTIVYDIHQMGRSGPRFFVPPFFDPKNANVHPLIDQSLMVIGGHMAQDLARENKKGVIHGAFFDNWWAGGFRATSQRHNMVGLLTEAASPRMATPVFQEKEELSGGGRGMPVYDRTTNFPDPWPGGWWRLRDVADYEKIACYSLLRLAARYRDTFQGNYLRLAREALTRGKTEPPFAWLVPTGQRDPGNTAHLLDILQQTGIEIHEAEEAFEADEVRYPAGTRVLYCEQPYRLHLNDLFELQTYPNHPAYPGGPVQRPYDIAGWTLPLMMGVRHVQVTRRFDVRTRRLDALAPPEPTITGPADPERYVVLAGRNDDFRLLNRLGRRDVEVSMYTGRGWRIGDTDVPTGSFVVRNGGLLRTSPELLRGVSSRLIGLGPAADVPALVPAPRPRFGLYQSWLASMDEGWTRWVLDHFEYQYASVHDADIRAGHLRERYDALILPSLSAEEILAGEPENATAPEYVGGITRAGLVALQDFVEAGGTLICIDESCELPLQHFNVPVKNVVAGKKREEFYCPGSLLRVSIDPHHPLGYGLPSWISAYFTYSQAFDVTEPAGTGRSPATRFPTTVVGRYSDTLLLESGFLAGASLIADKPALVESRYGTGRVVLLGFRVQHRAQPFGTFRLLFNAIQRSTL